MEELTIITRQEAGIASIDNFEELKSALQKELEVYKTIVYTPDTLKAAKKDKAALNKLKKGIVERRREIKNIILEPYKQVEEQAKELCALIDEHLSIIASFIEGEEEKEKTLRRDEIKDYFCEMSAPLGNLSDALWNSPAFFEKKWEGKSTSAKAWKEAVKEKIDTAFRDISSIRAVGGKYTADLLVKYFETLSMEGIFEHKTVLESTDSAADTVSDDLPMDDDKVIGYKVLKLTGTKMQLLQIMDQINLLGIEVDEIEDGMPTDMEELNTPDFDSFVAFDIETTGTFGAANGDSAPEITEIGAVKVVNGKIVDKFSQLANPQRKIVPRIAKLTHITDEMVQNEPVVDEVIRLFKDFVGDSVLVGHNIKNCDIPYISRASKRAGIAFENSFFDTYRYAKKMKDSCGWENVRLEYLSKQFGIEHQSAHRAWSDAEANVGIYYKLKEMKETGSHT